MLSDEARGILIGRMREVIARHGASHYLSAAIIEPDDRFFPDRYTPDLRGVRRVARRLARFAFLGDYEITVAGIDRADDDPMAETTIRFVAVDDGVLELGVEALGAAQDVPLVLAHEVAAAYRLVSAPRADGHPYRQAAAAPAARDEDDAEDDEVEEHEEDHDAMRAEEEEVSLTACYLGFGLLVTLGAHSYRAHAEIQGYMTRTRWQHRSWGALTPAEAAFLLALHGVVLDQGQAQFDRWAALMSPDARRHLQRYAQDLSSRRSELVDELGLPDPSRWPQPWDGKVPPIPEGDWEPESFEDDEGDQAPGREPVFLAHEHAGWTTAIWTAGFSSVAAVVLIGVGAVGSTLVAAVPVLVGAAFLLGRARRTSTCSGCTKAISADAIECAHCGGVVKGDLLLGENRHKAIERLGVKTTAQGFVIEGEQEDADPRYVELGVHCPSCGWIPDGERSWECRKCDAPDFDIFATGGECPGCRRAFDEVGCSQCGSFAEYDWWWPRD